VEGWSFLNDKGLALCTKDAMELMDQLMAKKQRMLVYNERWRRAGDDTPFKKWDGDGLRPELAPAFDDDPDPLFKGHR
jgi:hypothetical protein